MSVLFGNKTVTVYNKYLDKVTGEEHWLPTVLTKVNLVVTKGANIDKSGLDNADTSKLFVDVNEQNKPYVQPKTWNALTLAEKKNKFTFQEEETFFVQGDTSEVEVLEDGFLEYMLKHYDNVFVVTTVDAYTDIMEHLEVGGK